jgi:cobalt-zinc-cadmium efflux system protein
MAHVHHLGRDAGGADSRRLLIALAIALATAALEVAGSIVTGSLALLADAGHVFADIGALSLALLAIRVAARPHTMRWTFGFHRAEVLAASLNALALLAIAAFIVWRAVERLREPTEVEAGGLLAVASAGLLANLVALAVLRGSISVNVRAARLHVLSDLGGSVAAVAAGLILALTGWNRADPLLSLLIVALVVLGAVWLLRETAGILMARVPAHIDLPALTEQLQALDGVVAAHDVHCWTITSGFVAFACHLQLTPAADPNAVLAAATAMLRTEWQIDHVTIQPETVQLLTPDTEVI